MAHGSCGYQRTERTVHTSRKRFFWSGMHHDVIDYCRRCNRCQVAKALAQTTFRASTHVTANHPLEEIAIDFTQMEMPSDGRYTVMLSCLGLELFSRKQSQSGRRQTDSSVFLADANLDSKSFWGRVILACYT
ncbi:Pol polyprotein [Plakobranchus ocellatus]|uniref:Pol polyprotein n=1 Tax=Plakobranchus ocellatus TaxID=259542 RepID=A0AAV4BTQ9_9GAST|nr:Pol polyprotein [Plakobranchus ocellatus]